jgi:putative cardiolipin synthase
LAPRRSPLSQSPQSPAALPVGGCAAVLHDAPRPVSHAIDEPQHTQLARRFATQLPSEPGLTGFRLLTSAQDALLARAALAEVAPRALDLQYCVVADDETSTVLLYQALRAAQRGVRVRLLIDDLDVGDRDSHLAILASHPNVPGLGAGLPHRRRAPESTHAQQAVDRRQRRSGDRSPQPG